MNPTSSLRSTEKRILDNMSGKSSITCPVCGYTSYNPNDVKNRYCGNCHVFIDDAVKWSKSLHEDIDRAFLEEALAETERLKKS